MYSVAQPAGSTPQKRQATVGVRIHSELWSHGYVLQGWGVGLGAQVLTLPSPSAALSRPHGAQAPRLKAVLSHSSSGQSSGQRKRFCPFRVRFADETLRDTALRYWERSCAGKRTARGALGLQKVPAWSPESRCFGPGSQESGPASRGQEFTDLAQTALKLPSPEYQEGLKDQVERSEVLQQCPSVGGTREQSPWRPQWLPRPGHPRRPSRCYWFPSARSARLRTGTHSLPSPTSGPLRGLWRLKKVASHLKRLPIYTKACPAEEMPRKVQKIRPSLWGRLALAGPAKKLGTTRPRF